MNHAITDKELIVAIVDKFGSQVDAAAALGVKDRTFRNYVKNPTSIPEPARKGMLYLLYCGSTPPPSQPERCGEVRV